MTALLITSLIISFISCAGRDTSADKFALVKSAKADEKKYEIWYFVSKVASDTPYKVFVAKESILIEDDNRRSWSKLVFDDEQTDEDAISYKEVYIYSLVNCPDRTYSYRASRFYNNIGELVFSEDISSEPLPIVADTVSDYISRFVCSYSDN
jgi:hypothetical protein